MTVLEQITEMQNQGIQEDEIINSLKQQGVSPKEINDSLNQSQIKNAVAGEDFEPGIDQAPQSNNYAPSTQEISQENYAPPQEYTDQTYAPSQESYAPQTQEYSENSPPSTQEYSDEYAPQSQEQIPQGQEYYPQENYAQPNYSNSDTTIEIAEQVFHEKTKDMQTQIEIITEFKALAESRIENISERLNRIENTIDKLQSAILSKIGSYGTNLESIKKEMSMMQNTFKKTRKTSSTKKKSTRKKSSKK